MSMRLEMLMCIVNAACWRSNKPGNVLLHVWNYQCAMGTRNEVFLQHLYQQSFLHIFVKTMICVSMRPWWLMILNASET